MQDTILVINAGSSSIKFQLFAVTGRDHLERRVKGQIDGIGTRARLLAKDAQGRMLVEANYSGADVPGVPAALDKVIAFLRQQIGGRLPVAVGHRVVHGGPHYRQPTAITPEIVERLDRFVPLAPLHQPNNLAPIRAILERQPGVFQAACFDTAFHRGHPEVADRFAVPQSLYEAGVRRYGFHGLSYEYISMRLTQIAPATAKGRVVVAHLGSGASMCAIVAGKSVESTMGFTALDGLPMGTRSGQLDPGVVLYLMSQKHMSAKGIEHFLYNDCGLKGLSGVSNDVRELLASSVPGAKLALDCFTYRIALFAGMLAAAMGGIDGFVFTAGIGENAPIIREAVVRRLAWLGIELDAPANARGAMIVSSEQSPVPCYVVPTDEELMIATHTVRLLRSHPSQERHA
jgi:acetate kinase